MSVSFTRELNFGGSGVPETLPKASENRSQNVVDFFMEKTLKKEPKWAPKRPPKPIKKRPKTSLKKRLKNVRFRSPKTDAKSLRAATKLRLRRRPPTKEDPQKENHTKTNATFPGAHHARAPPARSGFLDAFWEDFASILEAKMHPKWAQKWKTCVFDFERLVLARA